MRDEQRQKFITQNGWGDATVTALPGDASRRRYFRLTPPNRLAAPGETRLVMDMPRHPEERFDEFILVANHLLRIGLSAPEVYAADAEHGFALIEDFGEDMYGHMLHRGHDPLPLYRAAIGAMAELQKKSSRADLALADYDTGAMSGEIGWFIDWYAPMLWGRVATTGERDEFFAIVRGVFDGLPPLAPTLLLRDFHIDNFMWLPDRPGVRACGILDFQDAKWGSPAYDLVSVLEDARRDIDPALARELYQQFLNLRPEIPPADFAAHYAAMGMLRHARILGNFIRLWVRDDKPRYLEFMPRVQRQFLNALEHPVAAPLRAWCAHYLPDVGEDLPMRPVEELKRVMLA